MGTREREGVAFLRWAIPRLGLRYEGFDNPRGQVLKRILRRARALGVDGFAGYRAYVEQHDGELPVLEALCRVTITRFGRDRAVFDALSQTVLPALAAGRAKIRCWSAGCASGEEPYTLALIDRFASPGVPLEIVATDADEALLARAARARYPHATLRELPRDWVERAFHEEDGWQVLDPAIAATVHLLRNDLRVDPPPRGPFEVVLCRNLAFTYFGAQAQRAALDVFDAVLADGGALVIGARERMPEDPRFEHWSRAIFRKDRRAGP
jgi:chemotaxis protein methyltransferase CheR